MGKKEFTIIALNLEHKTFIIHIIFLSFILLDASVYLSYRPQIASLITEKAIIKILTKYADFGDKFFLDLVFELFKYTRINNHTIELVNGR